MSTLPTDAVATPRFSIVVPCYNEARNIPLLLERFAAVMTRDDLEVILINNGSTDTSAEVLERLLPQYPFARTVLVPVNQGYGYGILSGLHAARGEFIGWTHADLQTDPGDVLRAIGLIEAAPEAEREHLFVKGQRRGRPLFDNVFTAGMSVFETVYMGEPLWDINAQPNLFHRSLLARWKQPPHDFSLDLFAVYSARRLGYRLQRFDVRFPERVHGESSWNTSWAAKVKFIRRTLAFSVQLKKELHDALHHPAPHRAQG